MAGIYIHIPYCSKACHYCNFHFTTSLRHKPEWLEALYREIARPALPPDVTMDRTITSVYLGGGTPSLLENDEIRGILEQVHRCYNVAEGSEITLEANPNDMTPQSLAAWQHAGINRLSIGIQSFSDEQLAWMNRAHNAQQALACIDMARESGFSNFSIDLIYGLPGMSHQAWEEQVLRAVKTGVPHLSCYALTVEEKTVLHRAIREGKTKAPDDEHQAFQFTLLMEILAGSGYSHYEISNFSLPGLEGRHNSSYWKGMPYYGFGPSAHSFDGKHTRWWNEPNHAAYIKTAGQIRPEETVERLSPVQRMNETIMTLLRTSGGLPADESTGMVGGYLYPPTQWSKAVQLLQQWMEKGWMEKSGQNLCLTGKGKLYADHIAASLFAEEE